MVARRNTDFWTALARDQHTVDSVVVKRGYARWRCPWACRGMQASGLGIYPV